MEVLASVAAGLFGIHLIWPNWRRQLDEKWHAYSARMRRVGKVSIVCWAVAISVFFGLPVLLAAVIVLLWRKRKPLVSSNILQSSLSPRPAKAANTAPVPHAAQEGKPADRPLYAITHFDPDPIYVEEILEDEFSLYRDEQITLHEYRRRVERVRERVQAEIDDLEDHYHSDRDFSRRLRRLEEALESCEWRLRWIIRQGI